MRISSVMWKTRCALSSLSRWKIFLLPLSIFFFMSTCPGSQALVSYSLAQSTGSLVLRERPATRSQGPFSIRNQAYWTRLFVSQHLYNETVLLFNSQPFTEERSHSTERRGLRVFSSEIKFIIYLSGSNPKKRRRACLINCFHRTQSGTCTHYIYII